MEGAPQGAQRYWLTMRKEYPAAGALTNFVSLVYQEDDQKGTWLVCSQEKIYITYCRVSYSNGYRQKKNQGLEAKTKEFQLEMGHKYLAGCINYLRKKKRKKWLVFVL